MKTVMPIEYEIERDIVEYLDAHSSNDERIAGVRTPSDFKDLIVLKVAEMA